MEPISELETLRYVLTHFEEPELRQTAVEAAGKRGPAVKELAPVLVTVIQTAREPLLKATQDALTKIDPELASKEMPR